MPEVPAPALQRPGRYSHSIINDQSNMLMFLHFTRIA
ncbi:hypothetical protein Tchar_00711 [Tepidimonas charontis]|uniref:Uncharacterized protein n=1 Tax=Tepidimonas charontis TaxID=2267262 RepID=A0A554XI47_9BURK|nr:hypothetical protein Tchar_00711 [Tepidimonas charontis]